MEGLGKELLNAAGTSDGLFVFVAELVDTQNGDDILQIFVALQKLFYALSGVVVLVTKNIRIENARGGSKRIDSRINAHFGNGARKISRRIEVSESGGWGRIGVVVGWNVNGLHGRDGAALG